MEHLLFIITIRLFLLSLLWCAVRAFYLIWWKPKSIEKHFRRQGITGSPYRILYGDLKEETRLTKEAWSKSVSLTHHIVPHVIPFIVKTTLSYGKICYSWSQTRARLIITDPEVMKAVLLDKHGYFHRPPQHPLATSFFKGLTSLDGEKWANHRRIINPAFYMDKLKGMGPAFSASCTLLMERWKNLTGTKGGSCEVDVMQEFQDFSGDVISRTAFGSDFEEGRKIFELQKEQAMLSLEAAQALYLPGFKFLPTKKNRRRMKLSNEITAILKGLVHKKEQAIKKGESASDDLLGLLLQYNNRCHLQMDGSNNSNYQVMTTEEVMEECKLFYFAGQETTALLLTWSMILLSMNPSWQEKGREEVKQICGDKLPQFDDLNHLKIVTMILYESIRLYPPTIQLTRYTYKSIKVAGISFPAGVEILIPILLNNHNPQLWGEDVEEFKPDRFSEGITKASKDPSAFYPFGLGPKICVGQNFAMIEAKMCLAMILQHFSFQLSLSYAHAPRNIITMQPQFGAQIILHRL